MSLLEEIQKEAVDSKSDLGALLRKCKVLAAHLGSQPLEDWLIRESNGYPNKIDVPDYRIWSLELKGHFSGPAGSGLRNALIPIICLPEKWREKYQHYKCRQSIASIEQTLAKDHQGILHVSTGDLAVFLGSYVYECQNCLEAWAEFAVGHLMEILNAVHNRILDFSLAIWKENPNAGEISTNSDKSIKPEKVTQIFNTTINGGGSATFVGNAIDSTITVNVAVNDFSSLERALRLKGVSEKDINDLYGALEADNRPEEKAYFGPKVSSWIAGMIKKAAEGGWQIAIGTAANLLADVISKYYGLK
jgi:hypothetical protein